LAESLVEALDQTVRLGPIRHGKGKAGSKDNTYLFHEEAGEIGSLIRVKCERDSISAKALLNDGTSDGVSVSSSDSISICPSSEVIGDDGDVGVAKLAFAERSDHINSYSFPRHHTEGDGEVMTDSLMFILCSLTSDTRLDMIGSIRYDLRPPIQVEQGTSHLANAGMTREQIAVKLVQGSFTQGCRDTKGNPEGNTLEFVIRNLRHLVEEALVENH
jgi:hypothetical protein